MMESRIVNYSDISSKCLLPARYLGRCFQCKKFESSRGIRCSAAVVPLEVKRYLDFLETMKNEKYRFDEKWQQLQDWELKKLNEKLQGGGKENGD